MADRLVQDPGGAGGAVLADDALPARQLPRTPPSNDILEGPVTSTLWKFSLPLMLGFFVHSLYSWVNMYFVGRLGSSAIAAVGFSEQINFFIFNLGSGFSIGAGVIIARRVGEGNREAAEEVARQSILFVLVASVVIALVLMALMPSILYSLGLDGETHQLAQSFMSVMLFGVPGIFVLFLINAIIRSTGNSVFAMKIMLLTVLINIILDPPLIFGWGPIPAMGVAGAGLSTATAQLTGAVLAVVAMLKGWAGMKLELKLPRFDFTIIKSIVRLGIPASLQMFSVSISRMSILYFANALGTGIAAAYTLGIRVDFFVFMPIFAIGIAIEIITGQHLGAKKTDRIFQFYSTAVRQLSLCIALLGAAMYFLAGNFARIFTSDPLVINETVSYLHIVIFSYPLFASGIIATRVISGAGAAFRSMLIVAGSMLGIMLPIAYGLSHWTPMREQGLWWGILAGYIFFAVIAYTSMRSKTWLAAKV